MPDPFFEDFQHQAYEESHFFLRGTARQVPLIILCLSFYSPLYSM
jgi:hypothetical protein